jgi:cell division protein FtsI/penicillin-binding protein 2
MLIPVVLTFIFLSIALLVALRLARYTWLTGISPVEGARITQSAGQTRRDGVAAANSWLGGTRKIFVLVVALVLGFHGYWVFWADSRGSKFSKAKVLDARNRRLAESGLKGWVLDRSGKLDAALIRYRYTGETLVREYPLGRAAVHLTGFSDFVYGSGGLEAAYRDWLTQSLSTYNRLVSPVPVGKDLQVSIDSNLQRELFRLLEATGKRGAAIVLGLPDNRVLALASVPSFDPGAIQDEDTWRRLADEADDPNTQALSPLVNRALGTLVTGGPAFYYRPGSTFKTFIAAVALDSGVTSERYLCKAEGFTPGGASRPIRDYAGEVHGMIGLREAFTHSCNQYFAQLGLKLGKARLAEYARRLRYVTDPEHAGETRSSGLWQLGHARREQFDSVFASPVPRMNLSNDASNYDVALESFGQGYDDFTVLSMALLAATAASSDGAIAEPTLEMNQQRQVAATFISPHAAAELRAMMRAVVTSGTAAGVFNPSVNVAGKTGTADRDVLVYDRQGRPSTYVDSNGKTRLRTQVSTDSWFIGFAPADNPRIAFAVMVENGGQGAKVAAPLAASAVEKAAALGLLKDQPGLHD